MPTLTELGLTPTQHAEVEALDDSLVAAWVDALADIGPKVKSPAGWFLAGVRSGLRPSDSRDARREQLVRLAERWMGNAGLYCPDETDVQDALFGQHGKLKDWADDEVLVERMLTLWRREQPRAEQAEAERVDRAARWREAHEKQREPTLAEALAENVPEEVAV